MEKEYGDEDTEKKVISILWQCISELEAWHRLLEEADKELCEGCSLCTLITRAEETNTEFICAIFEREGVLARPSLIGRIRNAIRKALGKEVQPTLGEGLEGHSSGDSADPNSERRHPMLNSPDEKPNDSGRSAGGAGSRSGIYLAHKREEDEGDKGGDVS